MSDLAIRVENIGKKYRIGATPTSSYRTLREVISDTVRSPLRRLRGETSATTEMWALRNISFEVRKGQVLGLIGRNGAGKSTLLKILSRVTEPTEGYAEIHGRVGSLLEVGTGFHPELTGRENIFLNGAILGMKRTEIARKMDEIIEFSEVEKFIDTPVKRYSSGMYLRLAFSVAAHLEPEILVVDEVLAVGDAEFQRKCLGKMNDVAQQGRTVLFVSHNMSAIMRLTEESLVIEQGLLGLRAPTAQAVEYYLSKGLSQEGQRTWRPDEIKDAHPFRPIGLRIFDTRGKVTDTVRSIEPFHIEMEYAILEPITGLRVGLYLNNVRGEMVFTSFDTDDLDKFNQHSIRQPGHYISRCTIPADFLNGGRFMLGINASSYHIKRYFQEEQAVAFNVNASGSPGTQWPEQRQGIVRPRLDWNIERIPGQGEEF